MPVLREISLDEPLDASPASASAEPGSFKEIPLDEPLDGENKSLLKSAFTVTVGDVADATERFFTRKYDLRQQERQKAAERQATLRAQEQAVKAPPPDPNLLKMPGSVLNGTKAPPLDAGAVATQGVPYTREFLMRVQRQMDAAAPAKRAELAARTDTLGRAAQEVMRQYAAMDKAAAPIEQNVGVTPAVRTLDTRREARSGRLARGGFDPEMIKQQATANALMGIGDSAGTVAEIPDDPTIDAIRNSELLNQNALARGIAKGAAGLGTSLAGFGQWLADNNGDFGMGQSAQAMRRRFGAISDAVGADRKSRISVDVTQAKDSGARWLESGVENAVSSIVRQAPGLATGRSASALTQMFIDTFGQEYGDARAAGKNTNDAFKRASIFGAFEVAGEKLGLDYMMPRLKNMAKGVDTDKLPEFLAGMLKREVPGELFTHAGESITDASSIGLRQDMTFAQYLSEIPQVIRDTVLQTGMMAGAGAGVGAATSAARNRYGPIDANPDNLNAYLRSTQPTFHMEQGQPAPAVVPPAAYPQRPDTSEWDAFLAGEQSDMAFRLRDLEQQQQKQRELDAIAAQSREDLGLTPAQQVARAAAATDEEPTAMELALRKAGVRPMPGTVGDLQSILDDPRPLEEIQREQAGQAQQADQRHAAQAQGTKRAISDTARRLANIGREGKKSAENLQEAQINESGLSLLASTPPMDGGTPADGSPPMGDGTRESPVQVQAPAHVEQAEAQVDTQPTDGQKEAGNYRMGHITVQGLPITIENPKGSVRSGTDKTGRPWSNTIHHTYGYIKGVEAKDGDKLDVFVGPNPASGTVFVIDQIDPGTGKYDEAKVMLGFDSADEARRGYLANYDQGWGGLGAMTPMSIDEFKAWTKGGKTHRPVAYTPTQPAARAQTPAPATPRPATAQPEPGAAGRTTNPDVAPGESAPQPTKEPSHGQGQETPEVLTAAEAGAQPASALHDLIIALIHSKGSAHNKDAVERAIERTKLLRERAATPADLSYLKRLQRILDQAKDKKSAAAIGDIIAEVKTEPNPAAPGQTRKTKPAETLLQAIKARGGIRIDLAQELTGEPPFRANRRFPGLFTRNGKGLDILAHDLAVEDGFDIHINLQSENDTGGVRQLEELIGRMLAGETIYNERGMEHAQEAEYRAGILDQAREKGILTRGRSFDAIEAELTRAVEDEKSRLEDEQLLDDYNAVRDELESMIGADRLDQLIRKLDERIGQLHGDDYTRQAITLLRSARDAIKERIQSRNAGETRPDVAEEQVANPGSGRDGNRPQEVEGAPRPDFTLQGQTEADIAEEERQRQAAEARQQEEERKAQEAERKAREDAEIAARQNVGGEFFSLDAQVNDKTAQKKADAKRAEDQLAGQGDIFGQTPAPPAEPQKQEVPNAVRNRVDRAIETLRDFAKSIENAKTLEDRIGQRGRYQADTWTNGKAQLDAARKTLDTFRTMAKEKGIDADAYLETLGGVPDLTPSKEAQEWLDAPGRGGVEESAPPAERFEAGRALTKEQRKTVLDSLVDVYRKNKAPKEFKGVDQNGNERYGYAYSPEFFVKSDITGAMVRYYVTLPDGRIAHPTELFPDYTQSDIDAEMQRRKTEEQNRKAADEFRLKTLNSRKAGSMNEANRLFWSQNRHSIDAQNPEYIPALLTNGTEFIRTDPANVKRDLELLGEGWQEKAVGAAADSKPNIQEHKIGDALTIMGRDVILAKQKTINGVRYELFNDAKLKDSGGATRVIDVDSGNVVSLRTYNDYAQAEAAYEEATPKMGSEEQKPATDFSVLAKDVGGRIAWTDGTIALIEGYSVLNGEPVYTGAKGVQRTRVDIRSFTGNLFTPEEKAALLKARAEAEFKAAEELRKNPDGPFSSGSVVISDDIPEKVGGVAREWIRLLGLDDARIVITTPEAGAEMAKSLFGRFRRIGKANLSGQDTNGIMQPLGDNDYHVALRPGLSILHTLEALAHELGHIVEKRAFSATKPAFRDEIRAEHEKWLKANGGGRAMNLALAMRAYRSGTRMSSTEVGADQVSPYWKSFGEWFADQVSRWATTTTKPRTAVERFFRRLADRLATFFRGERARFLPNAKVAEWLDSLDPQMGKEEDAAQIGGHPITRSATVFSSDGTRGTVDRIVDGDIAMVKWDGASNSTAYPVDQLSTTPQDSGQPIPAWHTTLPIEGLPPFKDQSRNYAVIPLKIAGDAYDAIRQDQLVAGMKMYAYVMPAANGLNGIVRLLPDDQTPPKPWKLLDGEGLRVSGMTRDQVVARIGEWLRREPILADEKGAPNHKTEDTIGWAGMSRAQRTVLAMAAGYRTNAGVLSRDGRRNVSTEWDGLFESTRRALVAAREKTKGLAGESPMDRDSFTLQRLNRDTQEMESHTFSRGQWVKVLMSGSGEGAHWTEGEITGISHAKREFRVGELDVWYPMGAAYETERPAAMLSRSGLNDYNEANGILEDTAGHRTIDGAELTALRREAAGLERPEAGKFLTVTEDGRAIATGKSRFSRSDSAADFALERLGDALINHEAQIVIGDEIPSVSVPNVRAAQLFSASGELEGNAAVVFRDGRIPMLVDIRMVHERAGLGEKYVRAMAASMGESGLMLYDIQKPAEGFWTKMGTTPENLGGELAHGNGFLFWSDYSQARVSQVHAARPAHDSASRSEHAEGGEDFLGRREAPLERGHNGRIHAEDLSAVAAEFRQVFPGMPILPVERESQLPPELQKAIRELGAKGDTAAAFHEDAVWLVRSGIHSLQHARRIVPHEATHAGLDWLLGQAKDRLLLDINRQNAAVAEKAKDIATRYRYSMVRATEEVLADMGPKVRALKGWNKLVAWVRRQFRKLGWVQEWTDRDVEDLVLQALAQAKKGPRAPFGVSRASAYARTPRFGAVDTASPEFKRWFGDSKVVDAAGRPLVVYHWTDNDFTVFDMSMSGEGAHFGTKKAATDRSRGMDGIGYEIEEEDGQYFVVADSGPKADEWQGPFATKKEAISFRAQQPKKIEPMALYLSIKNPIRLPDLGTWGALAIVRALPDGTLSESDRATIMDADDRYAKLREVLLNKGIDGFVYRNEVEDKGRDSYITFSPTQIKSAISNTGEFSEDPDIRLSRTSNAINLASEVLDTITQPSAKSFGMLKGLQTQLHKARTVPAYGRVFRLAMAFRNDLSRTAFRPWEYAKDILPAYDNIRGALSAIVKGKKGSKDIAAAGKFLFDGTMYGGGNPLSGLRYSDAKLKSLGATDETIRIYNQARDAIDASLDEMAAAVAWKLAKPYLHPAAKYVAINDPTRARSEFLDLLEIARDAAENQVGYPDQKTAEAAEKEIAATIKAVNGVFDHSEALKAAGYAPLMRFGKYTVSVREATPTGPGDLLEFSTYETETEAKFAEREAVKQFGQDAMVTRGILPESPAMFQGVDPETVALFAKQVGKIPGLDIDKAVLDEYYRTAVSQRSALTRTIKRKGVAGYSEDLPRVLASFLTSNARYISSTWHMGDMREAIQEIHDQYGKGDLYDEAQALYDYINGTKEPGAWMRGMMFAWYLGGSPAAAMINLTQPVMMTWPYLSQWKGAAKALASSTGQAMGLQPIPPGIRGALRRAQEEGVVEAQEIHHLYQEGMRPIISRLPGGEDLRARAMGAATIWGAFFGLAENFNRRITFLAAYKMASQNPELIKKFGSAYEFARRAVEETQGVYAKENRPNLARGTGPLGIVGVAAFTFKQYSIGYVELLARMWRSGKEGKMAAGLMLGLLALASGLHGLPFAEDLEDLIDTILQSFGYKGNIRKAMRDQLKAAAGERIADIVLYGASAETPVDVQARLGLGNMIPATGIAKPSEQNKAGQVAELFGPPGGMARSVGDFVDALQSGGAGDAFKAFSPKMVQDARKAWQMWETGQYRDSRGRNVAPVSKSDAAIKAIGFQPTSVAEPSRKARLVQQDIGLAKKTEAEIVGAWAQARIDGDKSGEQRARDRLADWNRKNPEARIRVDSEQIIARIKQMKIEREGRILKSAPKEMRGYAAEALK